MFFAQDLKMKIFLYFIVTLLLSLYIFETRSSENRTCQPGDCISPPSKDAGRFGVVNRVKITPEELVNVISITVENTSFFRVIYSENYISQWYYSPSFSLGHSTKLDKVFQMQDIHQLVKSKSGMPIFLEANTVGDFQSCPEVVLTTSLGKEDRICLTLPKKKISFLFFYFAIILPGLSIYLIYVFVGRKRHLLTFEITPAWFAQDLKRLQFSSLKIKKDFRFLFYVILGCFYVMYHWRQKSKLLYNFNNVRNAFKNIALFYVSGHVIYHSPRLVLSFIDNSQFILRFAAINPHVNFIIVQNGFRSKNEIGSLFEDVKELFYSKMSTIYVFPNSKKILLCILWD